MVTLCAVGDEATAADHFRMVVQRRLMWSDQGLIFVIVRYNIECSQ
jgi:hypothetical protein